MRKRWKLITTLLVLALVAICITLIPAALADEDATTEPPETNSFCDNFINKLSTNLNMSVDQLISAIQATEIEMIDEAAASGRLTDEQAALIKERIENNDGVCGLLGPRFFKPAHRPCFGPVGILDKAVGQEIITQEQVDAIIETLKDVREYVREKGGPLAFNLGAAVTQGVISQEQADEIISVLQDIKSYVQENQGEFGLRGGFPLPFGGCRR